MLNFLCCESKLWVDALKYIGMLIKSFYPATITAFDDQHYSHRIEHDDGDIEPAAKLWEMRVNLLVDNSGV